MKAGRGRNGSASADGAVRPPSVGGASLAEDAPDVVVVGAGPAGSAAATVLAQAGHATVLLDRAVFPRPKACGECLNPGALVVLERLGLLAPVLERTPAILQGWRIRWPEEGGEGAGPRGEGGLVGTLPQPQGLGLPREALDHALLEAARAAGAMVLEGVTAQEVHPGTSPETEEDPGDRAPVLHVRHDDGRSRTLRPRYVVVANGLQSRFRKTLGVGLRPPRHRKTSVTFHVTGPLASPAPTPGSMDPPSPGAATRRGAVHTGSWYGQLFLAAEGTLGLAPVSPDGARWNATLVVDPAHWGRRLATDARDVLARWLDSAPGPWSGLPEVLQGPLGSGPFDRPVARVRVGRVLLAGDAAGYYDPLTGQGIYRALRSGAMAGEALVQALRHPDGAASSLREFDRALPRTFAPGRRVQRCVDAALRMGFVRPHLLEVLARRGARLDPLVAVTGDAAPARTLLRLRSLRTLGGAEVERTP